MTAWNARSIALCCWSFFLLIGASAGPARAADPSNEKVLFAEDFKGELLVGWSWYREIRDHWKIDKERNELLIQPVAGWMTALNNVPLCAVPSIEKQGSLAVEVHIDHVPAGDYEFSGLMWYFDDQNFVVIRKGPHGDDGKSVALLLIKDGAGKWIKSTPYQAQSVDLRMVINGTKAEGWFRASSTEKWQSIAEVDLPRDGAAKVGLRTGNGEGKPSWARFSKFRFLQLPR